MRLMGKFGYLTETTPSSSSPVSVSISTPPATTPPSGPPATTSGGSGATSGGTSSGGGSGSVASTTGTTTPVEGPGLGWLALRDFGWHLNQYIKRPIIYEKDDLASLDPGTAILIIKGKAADGTTFTHRAKVPITCSTTKSKKRHLYEDDAPEDEDYLFKLIVGDHKNIVLVTPDGDYINLCSIKTYSHPDVNVSAERAKREPSSDFKNSKAKHENDPSDEELENSFQNETRRRKGCLLTEDMPARKSNGPDMVHEPVNPSYDKSGGIVKMGGYWLFLRTLEVGSDARLAGPIDRSGQISYIHSEFVAWFRNQPKLSYMPMPGMNNQDSDFGKYLISKLRKGGAENVILSNENGFSITCNVSQDHEHIVTFVLSQGGDYGIGQYIHTETKKVDVGYDGYIHCGDDEDNVIGFRYFTNQKGVVFYYKINGQTSQWLTGCQGILVDLIKDYFVTSTNNRQRTNGNNVSVDDDDEDLEDDGTGYEPVRDRVLRQASIQTFRSMATYLERLSNRPNNNGFITTGMNGNHLYITRESNGAFIMNCDNVGSVGTINYATVDENDGIMTIRIDCEYASVTFMEDGSYRIIFSNGREIEDKDTNNGLWDNVFNPILNNVRQQLQTNESLEYSLDRILNEIKHI